LKRVKDAVAAGKALPMALREQRIWGPRERLFERVLPRLSVGMLDKLLQSTHQVDGIVKGLKVPKWPTDSRLASLAPLGHAPVPRLHGSSCLPKYGHDFTHPCRAHAIAGCPGENRLAQMAKASAA
jgi:hypothetical protein